MTPEERSLVTGLFDRLAEIGNTERDPEAERAISDGLRRAPNAVYALVQTALVQDEALKRADARIRDLEAQLGEEPQQPRSRSFLGSMRDATGRRGSVPAARPSDAPMVAPTDYRSPPLPMSAGPGASNPGGSFLGTAAAAAAGVIGSSLMLDSIRSMMGRRQGGGYGATMPSSGMASGSESPSATAPASAANVGREAGHDDTRSGDDDPGSSHGDDQVDDGDYQDHSDYQHDGDFDDGSEDFDDGSGDFDDGGDLGGADEEV
jgi:hypothetical protein